MQKLIKLPNVFFSVFYKVTSACSWNETKLISLKNKHIYFERLEPANKILIQGKEIQKLKKQMKLCPIAIETDRFQKVSQKIKKLKSA